MLLILVQIQAGPPRFALMGYAATPETGRAKRMRWRQGRADKPHMRSSSPAKAGGSSTPRPLDSILASLEYRVTRRSLSSGAHSRDPLAGDDIFREGGPTAKIPEFPR
ncbi:hypothetical protein V1293_003653 [Bradyrhizobium sp. AZCC 1693]